MVTSMKPQDSAFGVNNEMDSSNGDVLNKIDEDAWWHDLANSYPPPFLGPAIAVDPLYASSELEDRSTKMSNNRVDVHVRDTRVNHESRNIHP
mgnify:CR=1 FL=1